jgi:hypothetical protein
MAYISAKTTVLYVTEEITEGTPVNPSAGNQAVSILSDGFELNGEKELVERNNLTASIAKALPRVGIKTAAGTIGVEAKAALVAGAAPEADSFFKAALGGKRTLASTVTTGTSHATNSIKLTLGSDSNFLAGDIIMLKDSNLGYHVTPITAVVSSVAATNFIQGSVGRLTFTADVAGVTGNSITVELTGGGTAGAEVVTVVGNDIEVQIETGVSTAAQIKTALDNSVAAAALD